MQYHRPQRLIEDEIEPIFPLSNERKRYLRTTCTSFFGLLCIVASCLICVALPIILGTYFASLKLPSDPILRAKRLADIVPLIDGHNDFALKFFQIQTHFPKFRLPINRTLTESEIEMLNKTGIVGILPHTNVPLMKNGSIGGQFWSTFVDCTDSTPIKSTLRQFDIIHNFISQQDFYFSQNVDDIYEAFYRRKIASLIGIEGGHAIEDSIHALRMFFNLGARYLTLTHNCHTKWAESCCDPNIPEKPGLNDFGKRLIWEMNWLGMMVDLSHSSTNTMKDVLLVSKAPVIFSHSNAYAICKSPKNVPDDVLKSLKTNKGIIMVSFHPLQVTETERLKFEELKQKYNSTNEQFQKLIEWENENPHLRANISHVIDHIDHIKQVCGIDCIGIGSNFDGIPVTVQGLENTSKYVHLIAELIRRGYNDDEIKKIMGLNIMRVMKSVREVAVQMQRETPINV